ncbi:MAG TPA: carbon-nitrogen hydrolase family protein [Steroidobacteraceae bacterium]|jgi:N-carbamoylputrescine amidase|nr:carbon-nitrogen hydrolase family protein [Steroidobacteraceae bacterium]
MALSATVTVCEFHDGDLAGNWQRLAEHVASEFSQIVVLPEMPFASWLPRLPNFKNRAWDAAVDAHDRWERRLHDLAPALVAATRPVDFGNERYNQGFIWTESGGARAVHAKSWLNNQDGCWERFWYQSAPAPDFEPFQVGDLTLGFLIGAELAAYDEAERYGREGVQLLVSPRSTPVPNVEAWLAVAQSAARRAGAMLLTSSGAGQGPGWIIDPRGELLASTSHAQPFVSRRVELPAKSFAATEVVG